VSTARELLAPLHAGELVPETLRAERSWASSEQDWELIGGGALTAGGVSLPGLPMARLTAASAALETLSAVCGHAVRVHGPGLLTERARLVGMEAAPPPGSSLRGAARMLRHPDGWSVFNLPRPSDRALLPALSDGTTGAADTSTEGPLGPRLCAELDAWAASTPRQAALERALLLDLAAAAVPAPGALHASGPFRLSGLHPHAWPSLDALRVADLSTLWAGPLLGAVLAEGGARVSKIESQSRPERPEPADRAFTERLNGAKERRLIDFAAAGTLQAELAAADIVIVSARRRALERLGIVPRPGQLLVRITGHGHEGQAAARVGFGDDCAAAAGAVGWLDGRPVFAGDALADPVTGLLGAVAVFGLLRAGQGGVVDLDLASSARWLIADAAEPAS
jgi:hypothetical protein